VVIVYEEIGGYEVIDKLVNDFYSIMREDDSARRVFATHAGKDFEESAKKLKSFLSGWLGGPQLYLETYGHPRLRMRHFPFSIGEEEASEWLYCMRKALARSTIRPELQAKLAEAFHQVTTMLKNRP
jgi:hemoglobin